MDSLSINALPSENFEQATEIYPHAVITPTASCTAIEPSSKGTLLTAEQAIEIQQIEIQQIEIQQTISEQTISEQTISEQTISEQTSPKTSKSIIRRSLKASTMDGVFASVFSNTTSGVLLSNFLLNLGASSTQIGLLASIPMLANLVQPIGAYFSEKTTSRHKYCFWIYSISRLMWVVLAIGIFSTSWYHFNPKALIFWTLGISLTSHLLGALGSASWLSWMAVLVPRRLRGRYFGFRNSAANLTHLVSIPLLGLLISLWFRGTLEGFGVVLGLGVLFGMISLGFQFLIVDVNPQMQHSLPNPGLDSGAPEIADQAEGQEAELPTVSLKDSFFSILKDTNFLQRFSSLSRTERGMGWCPIQRFHPCTPYQTSTRSAVMFLLYFNLWMFSVNLCAPFFNLYLLDNLKLDISQVTLYNSFSAAANLLMLLFWGKFADRVGNRPILIGVGVLVAVTPMLWLITDANTLSIWLWLPFLHILGGATWAAIDLCTNNLQIGVAPLQNQSAYFGTVAAVAGASGALGTLAGGYLAQLEGWGGLFGIFALSSVLRLISLLPLFFVHEQRSQPLHQLMQLLFPTPHESSV